MLQQRLGVDQPHVTVRLVPQVEDLPKSGVGDKEDLRDGSIARLDAFGPRFGNDV